MNWILQYGPDGIIYFSRKSKTADFRLKESKEALAEALEKWLSQKED